MTSKKMLWASYIMSTLPVLMLLFSGIMKLVKPPSVVEGFAHLGYDDSVALALGLVELLSTLLYVIPRTSVLGAILLTGYLGGATATHSAHRRAFLYGRAARPVAMGRPVSPGRASAAADPAPVTVVPGP